MINYSFIIPVFNCIAYLSNCISCIQSVGLNDYEILLIDDGSTDGSGKLCDELASQYPEIRVIHQANAGVSAARNRGIAEANGEKILFIDSDDSFDSDALHTILEDPRCDQADLVIFGLTFDYYKHGSCYRRDPLFHPFDGIMTKIEWGSEFTELYTKNSLSPIWNKVFKRSILLQHNLRLNEDMFLYEDLEFVLRYMQHCQTIWNVPKAIYHYRQSEDEGNSKRRLMRIDRLPVFLQPIEAALASLLVENPAVGASQRDQVLQQLYLVLAREKISVSSLGGIRKICKDFAQWFAGRNLPLEESPFQKKLKNEQAFRLLLADKKSALRHKLAVWVKSHIYKF